MITFYTLIPKTTVDENPNKYLFNSVYGCLSDAPQHVILLTTYYVFEFQPTKCRCSVFDEFQWYTKEELWAELGG